MNSTLLETINLRKTYKHINGNITLFNNLNLKIKRGDLVALIGPSGSGKSSLLHLLALLDDPSKGKILINNKEMKNLNDTELSEYLAKIQTKTLLDYGVYQIEADGLELFEYIKGDQDSIMGLPIKDIINYINQYNK